MITATTIADLDGLTLAQVLPDAHIIVAAGGRCLCGLYDGKAIGCRAILARLLLKETEPIAASLRSSEVPFYDGLRRLGLLEDFARATLYGPPIKTAKRAKGGAASS